MYVCIYAFTYLSMIYSKHLSFSCDMTHIYTISTYIYDYVYICDHHYVYISDDSHILK